MHLIVSPDVKKSSIIQYTHSDGNQVQGAIRTRLPHNGLWTSLLCTFVCNSNTFNDCQRCKRKVISCGCKGFHFYETKRNRETARLSIVPIHRNKLSSISLQWICGSWRRKRAMYCGFHHNTLVAIAALGGQLMSGEEGNSFLKLEGLSAKDDNNCQDNPVSLNIPGNGSTPSAELPITIIVGTDLEGRLELVRHAMKSLSSDLRIVYLAITGPPGFFQRVEPKTSRRLIPSSDMATVVRELKDTTCLKTAQNSGKEDKHNVKVSETLSRDKTEGIPGRVVLCADKDELYRELQNVIQEGNCDYLILDAGATSEPQVVAKMIETEFVKSEEDKESQTVRIDSIVTVINSLSFFDDLYNPDSLASRIGETEMDASQIFISQIEYANVIVLNDIEQVSEENLNNLEKILRTLNTDALRIRARAGKVPVSYFANSKYYQTEKLDWSPTWKKLLSTSSLVDDKKLDGGDKSESGSNVSQETTDEKEDNASSRFEEAQESNFHNRCLTPEWVHQYSYVYSADRPFNPKRLYSYISNSETFRGVIRSVGKIWLATRMGSPWNGINTVSLKRGSPFYVTLPREEWPKDDKSRNEISANWNKRFGDRKTVIVFLGVDINRNNLERMLDSCLLQDEEMVFTDAWASFEDPFKDLVPMDNDGIKNVTQSDDKAHSVDDSSSRNAFLKESLASDDANINTASPMTPSAFDVLTAVATETQETIKSNEENQSSVIIDSSTNKTTLSSSPVSEDKVVLLMGDDKKTQEFLRSFPKTALPITILTGFLGSGKTTLLNYLLKQPHQLKIAVLINEFGEIDIDSRLVERNVWKDEGNTLVELSNGCICCSVNGSFVEMLERLLKHEKPIDYIIVETTGLADPMPLIHSIVSTDLVDHYRLDGIITTVDAENFDIVNHYHSKAALNQILSADTVLLSKTDLVSQQRLNQLLNFLQNLKPNIRVLECHRGQVPLNMILDIAANSSSGIEFVEGSSLVEAGKNRPIESFEHTEEICSQHDHASHLEEEGFVSVSFETEQSFDVRLFRDYFLQKLPNNVFRAKGLLKFQGYPQRYIFQLSGRRVDFDEDEWPAQDQQKNQIVLIGRDLNASLLERILKSCLAK
eukprot:jgi/Galph1/5915/GphlegSOOS_G4582.1